LTEKQIDALSKTLEGKFKPQLVALHVLDTVTDKRIFAFTNYGNCHKLDISDPDLECKLSDEGVDLKTLSKDAEYGYIFRTLACLCSVLTYKHDLGLQTRRAYQTGDKETLYRLAVEIYPETATRLERLYDAFCAQWEKECKLEGFEVHDIRLGGLIQRVRHCQKVLLQYINGEIDEIAPLKTNPLPYQLNTEKGEGFILSQWIYNAMVKPMN
jgi:hypothetical protein